MLPTRRVERPLIYITRGAGHVHHGRGIKLSLGSFAYRRRAPTRNVVNFVS